MAVSGARHLAVVGVALIGQAGCSDDDEGVDCTTDVRRSVLVTVLDSNGALVPDAQVSYSTGGAPQPCDDLLGGLYGCGSELRGDFAIEAARGGVSAAISVEVSADECHVITREIELVLPGG
jgi:hypothetical protein